MIELERADRWSDIAAPVPADGRVLLFLVASAVATDLALRNGLAGLGGAVLAIVLAGGLVATRRFDRAHAIGLLAGAAVFGSFLAGRTDPWSSLVAVAESPVQTDTARALVLVDVAHRVEIGGRERIGEFMRGHLDGFATLDDAADAIAAYNPHRPRPTDLSGLAKNLRLRDDGRWHWHWDPRFVDGKFGSEDETRSSVIDPGRLEHAVDMLEVPVLLVRGRSSDLLSEDGARDFLARVPHAEFADVAGAGHMVAGDRNEIFNRAILTFLTRHRP
jgi:pimeloyl-ACP methyl ester carboxylesterase